MKKSHAVAVVFLLFGAGLTAQAGTLSPGGINGCSRGVLNFDINWVGPWSETWFVMEYTTLPSSTWNWHSGSYNYSPGSVIGKSGRKYRMMASPAGTPYVDSNVLRINEYECEVDP